MSQIKNIEPWNRNRSRPLLCCTNSKPALNHLETGTNYQNPTNQWFDQFKIFKNKKDDGQWVKLARTVNCPFINDSRLVHICLNGPNRNRVKRFGARFNNSSHKPYPSGPTQVGSSRSGHNCRPRMGISYILYVKNLLITAILLSIIIL